MIKVFISQPMRGKTEKQILDEKNKAISSLTKLVREEVEIIDTYFKDFNGNRIEFLGKSILDGLGKCDVAVFLNGWDSADGCLCEHFVAVRYGVKCLYL